MNCTGRHEARLAGRSSVSAPPGPSISPVASVDLRLVVQHELVLVERAAQPAFERKLLRDARVHRRLVEEVALAAHLRLLQRGFGVREQRFPRRRRRAGYSAMPTVMPITSSLPVQHERLGERGAPTASSRCAISEALRDVLDEPAEVVGGKPRHLLDARPALRDARGDLAQQLVACVASEACR